ncbi:hypothetical protein RvY_15272 [Ramazzottius varieornatus]|uniref:Gustatory receptor n=1 Tax=Ramazzottius varieornatus TaxID=947166 RepID=A0A1D1VUA7_RAMVA|nr:hypothetical protein RvY_15272 [Ramazzottius varieornatus]
MAEFSIDPTEEVSNGHCLETVHQLGSESQKSFYLCSFHWLKVFRLIPSRKLESQSGRSSKGLLLSIKPFLVHFYYFFFLAHSFLYLLEVAANLSSTTVNRDSSVKNLKYLLYNCRYGFMVIKSAVLFLSFRMHGVRIIQLTTAVADEYRKLSHGQQKLLSILTVAITALNVVFSKSWHILDFASYDLSFHETWFEDVEVALFGQKAKLWMVEIAWYSLATPMIIVTDLAVVFVALSILTLYLAWRRINEKLAQDPSYLVSDFGGEWEHLRCVAEAADDAFSFIIFTAWINDMACAVGYIGSIVLYGAGNPPEQAYTLLQMIQQNILSYRPAAFTAWKFFYVTRNVLLTLPHTVHVQDAGSPPNDACWVVEQIAFAHQKYFNNLLANV